MNIEFWRKKYQLLKLAIFNEIYCNQGTSFVRITPPTFFKLFFGQIFPYKVQHLHTNLLAVLHKITLIFYVTIMGGGGGDGDLSLHLKRKIFERQTLDTNVLRFNMYMYCLLQTRTDCLFHA